MGGQHLVITQIFCVYVPEIFDTEIDIPANMYTYDIQYVDFDIDHVKEMGLIDSYGAVNAFRSFPFKEQHQMADSLPEPTFPTISFHSRTDEWKLAIWSYEPDIYEVYMEGDQKKVTIETRDESLIVKSIESFFSGNRIELYKQLASATNAVTVQSFWSRIVSIFERSRQK